MYLKSLPLTLEPWSTKRKSRQRLKWNMESNGSMSFLYFVKQWMDFSGSILYMVLRLHGVSTFIKKL